MAKLRIVYYEDEDIVSYFHLEKSEGLRVVELLKILPQLQDWTPIFEVSANLNINTKSLLRTIHKIVGARKIDVLVNGERKVIKRFPVLFIKKDEMTGDQKMQKFLRPVVYVRNGILPSQIRNQQEIEDAYRKIRSQQDDKMPF